MKTIQGTDVKVAIRRRPDSFLNEIYIYARQGNATVFFTFHTEGGSTTLTNHRVEEAGAAIPALVLSENMVRDIIQGFMAEGKELGIKAPDESFAEGKLEAQGRHLDDLRKLLKLP